MLQHKQFQGLSCPAFLSGHFPTHCSSPFVFSSKPADTLCRGHIAALLLLWRRKWTALPTLLWPRSPIWAQPEPSDTNPAGVPASSCVQPSGWHPGLTPAHPCARAGAAPSCPIPWLESWGCAVPAPWSPHCFCIPGSCWTSLAHRCHDSVVGSAPASFNIIQYFMDLGPWFYSDISLLAITMGKDQAAQNNINPWNSLKMLKILIWDYFLHWGGCSKSQLIDCVTKPISFLCEYINCDDNTLRNPEGPFFKSSLMKICVYFKQISVSICFKDLGENILKSTLCNRDNGI